MSITGTKLSDLALVKNGDLEADGINTIESKDDEAKIEEAVNIPEEAFSNTHPQEDDSAGFFNFE